jgi:DNA-directed RNA polymerase subunit RPC12/RpoP
MELRENPPGHPSDAQHIDPRPRLRCERCGHALVATDPGARCPECGVSVDESRPELRPGVPWQRGPSLGSWLATIAAYVRSPFGIYRRVRIDSRSARSLLFANIVATCVIGFVPAVIVSAFGPANVRYETAPSTYHIIFDSFPFLAAILLIVAVPLALVATWLSASIFAKRKSPPMATAVPWCSAGLNTCGMVMAMLVTDGVWFVRYLLTPREVIAGNGAIGMGVSLSMAPILLFLVLMVAIAIMDSIAGRANRYANSLDPAQ